MSNHRMAGRSTRGGLRAGTATQLSPIESPAQAELEPQTRQAFAEQLLDRVPEAIVLVDQQSRILRVNPEFTRLFGHSPAEVAGQIIDDLIVPEHKKNEGGQLGREVLSGKTVEIETKRRRKDGELIDVSLLVAPVQTPNGQVGYYAIYRDIRHRKHAEELRAAAQDELRESEAKFRAVAETAPCAIFIHRGAKPLYINPAACVMSGYSREELMKMEVWEIIHPDYREMAKATSAARARGEHTPPHYEFKFLTKKGEEHWVDFRGTPIHYQGELAVLGIAFDVSDKKAADEELRRQSTLLEQLFEASPEAVLLLDLQHRAVKVNREFTRMFGYTEEETKGKTAAELSIVPEGKEKESKGIIRTVEESGRLNLETQRVAKDGRLVDVSILGTPVEVDGKQEGYYAIYRDISLRKQAERELQKLNVSLEKLNVSLEHRVRERTAQLQGANQELEAFSYSVSHDLRAPLRHIDGFVKLLLRREQGKLDATSEKYFHDIADSSRHMGALIDDLLAFSRTSRVELKEQAVELNELFASARDRLQHGIAATRKVVWEFGQMPAVRADYSLLRIAVTNLLSNALKYSAPREVSRIGAGVSAETADEVTIFVSDNGVGFDMQYAHKLFGVFQRLHRDEEFEGTGIGLATVRRILARHGGKVWGEAKPDEGAKFYFTLRKAN